MPALSLASLSIGDQTVQYVYNMIASASGFTDYYKLFTLAKFPHASAIMAGCNLLNAAVNVYTSNIGKPPRYWLHSLLLVVLAGCGGGILVGPMLGRPAGVISNGDVLVTLAAIAWYSTHYLGLFPFFQSKQIKLIWGAFVALYKTHSVVDTVNIAKNLLTPSIYYPTPFIGPIIAGTITGCGGFFFPMDKGLNPIASGTSWTVQGPILTAFTYHALVNDHKGFIGVGFRSIIGTYTEPQVRVLIATVLLITHFGQTLFSPDVNLFTPIHKLGYLIFQVTGPTAPANAKKSQDDTVGWDFKIRLVFEKVMDLFRMLAVFAVISGHIYVSQPPAIVPSGQLFKVGDSIGTCQFLPSIQKCNPYILRLESKEIEPGSVDYFLASYNAAGKYYAPVSTDVPVWTLSLTSTLGGSSATKGVILGNDGVVRLINRSITSEQDEVLWSSVAACPSVATNSSKIFFSLDTSGKPYVLCTDGSKIQIA